MEFKIWSASGELAFASEYVKLLKNYNLTEKRNEDGIKQFFVTINNLNDLSNLVDEVKEIVFTGEEIIIYDDYLE